MKSDEILARNLSDTCLRLARMTEKCIELEKENSELKLKLASLEKDSSMPKTANG